MSQFKKMYKTKSTKEEKLVQRVKLNASQDLLKTLEIRPELASQTIFSFPDSPKISILFKEQKENVGLMHIAAYYDSLECLKILHEKGAKIDQLTIRDFTPLHYVCAGSSVECALYLIQNNANVNSTTKKQSYSPLYYAAASCSIPILHALFDNGALLQDKVSGQSSPLSPAISNKYYDCVEIMLERGYKPSARDGVLSPLHQAITNKIFEVVPHLLKHGADPNSVTKNGLSPVILAIQNNNIDVLRQLIAYGANIQVRDSNGKNLIHYACQTGNLDIYKLLVEMDVSPLVLDNNGKPPSFNVLSAPPESMIPLWKELFEAGVDINTIAKDNSSILMETLVDTKKVTPQIMEFLLENGANLDMKGENGKTCYAMAKIIYQRQPNILNIIEKYHQMQQKK